MQQANIPSMSLVAPDYPTPFVKMPYAGDHIDYGDLRLTYLVDERLSNYLEIFDWMRALGKPDSFGEYARIKMEPGTGVASDCVLAVLDAKRNLRASVTYRDAVPVELSDVTLDARLPDNQYASVTCVFRFIDFHVKPA